LATDKTIAEWVRFHALDLRSPGAARAAFEDAVSIEDNDRSLGMAGPPPVRRSVQRETVVAIFNRLKENDAVPAADYLTLGAYILDLDRAIAK
jgi:hypothetical protein